MSTLIKLNVGGVTYLTSKDTLMRYQETFLYGLVSGNYDSLKIEDSYFIDRDGQIFIYILNFLRNGDNWVPPTDIDKVNQILTEAKFYCLEPLVKYLEEIIKAPVIPKTHFDIIYYNDLTLACTENAPDAIKILISKHKILISKHKEYDPFDIALYKLFDLVEKENYVLVTGFARPHKSSWKDAHRFVFRQK